MILTYRNRAILGISSGLLLSATSLVVILKQVVPEDRWGWFMIPFVGGLGLYCWGCSCLAIAKGYSSALVLTVVLGVLLPLVVLLALPDKHSHRDRHHRTVRTR
jgi:hypothetical protein